MRCSPTRASSSGELALASIDKLVAFVDIEEGSRAPFEYFRRCSLAVDRSVFNLEVVDHPSDPVFEADAARRGQLAAIIGADGVDVRGRHVIFQQVCQARAARLQGELHARSEFGEKLIGPTSFKIELHFDDIASPPEAFCSDLDFLEPFEFLVSLVLEEILELLLGHRFHRIHLQFGQTRVEFPADDLSPFMVGTVKAE